MTRIAKIDNAIKKRLSRKEKSRATDARKERIYFLIVCEGEKTEPNHFEALKKDLPKGTLVIADVTIQGTGKNTESLVDFTLKHQKRFGGKFDRVWAVFDRIVLQRHNLTTPSFVLRQTR